MNKNKNCSILYLLSAICFYLTSILKFIKDDDLIEAIINFALGSTCLCLGLLWYKQWKKEETKK